MATSCAGKPLRPPGRTDETTDHPVFFSLVLDRVPAPLLYIRPRHRAFATRTLPSSIPPPLLSLPVFSSLLRPPRSTGPRRSLLGHRGERRLVSQQMDPWISSQPSLSLDLHVGLPPLSLHQAPVAAVALARPKVLVEENFLPPKKEPEVYIYTYTPGRL